MNMLKLLLVICTSLVFTSCTQLWFVQPVPQQSTNEAAFPNWAIGTFASSRQVDTLVITQYAYSLLNKDVHCTVGDSLVIRHFENYLVVNQKLGEHWQPMFLKPRKNGTFDMYAFDVSTEKKMNRLKRRVSIQEDSTGKENIFLTNPTDRELRKMTKSRSFALFGNFIRVRP